MRKVILLLTAIIFVSGCSKPAETVVPESSDEADYVAPKSIPPAHCTKVSSGPHTFKEWDTLMADEYDCQPDYLDKMNCKMWLATSGESEVICETANPANPQGAPVECANFTDPNESVNFRVHLFLSGEVLKDYAYSCPRFNDALKCVYFKHEPVCNDSDLNPGNDCQDFESENFQEELICQDVNWGY